MWIIKQILEADYGCEERMPGEKLKCLVYLENDQGEQRRIEVEDDWLCEWSLDEGTVWPGEQSRILGALIGLTGAVSNSGKTLRTDLVVAKALLQEDSDAMVSEIHAEKHQIHRTVRRVRFLVEILRIGICVLSGTVKRRFGGRSAG